MRLNTYYVNFLKYENAPLEKFVYITYFELISVHFSLQGDDRHLLKLIV